MIEGFSFKSLAELFALPPANLFLLFVAGLIVARRRPRLGRTVQCTAVLLLYALSTPLVAGSLLRTVEPATQLDPAAIPGSGAGAIVVLSGEMERTPEYGGATIGPFTLERVRYAARLVRLTSLPVLVTGGVLKAGAPPIAALMRDALSDDFGITPRWIEDRSHTTDENARFSAALLRHDGVGTIVLVTQGFHMRRAALAFAEAGLTVIPAPTMLTARESDFDALIPTGKALQQSLFAAHEWIGLAWYRLRYALSGLI
ncbi:MAG TPA: YdcF family protein [Stellaceae bacterium]|nr:YdcF family protein [Stellaceae bacterium]